MMAILPSQVTTRVARSFDLRLAALGASSQRHLSYSPPRRKDPNTNDDDPWWSLSSLHKRVATVLATSLPDSYRSDLQQSLSDSLNEEDSHKSHSVNEAIVSAQAREAYAKHKSSSPSFNSDQMQAERLEQQKKLEEEIEKRALEKAQERVQFELIAMKEQMKKQQQEERRRLENEERKKQEIKLQRKIAYEEWRNNVEKEKKDQEQEVPELVEDISIKTEVETHPILGQQLADLSYKRIHLMSATTLASLPVYEKQRAYRHDRAQLMAKDKKKTLWMGIPGVISLMEDESGKLAILDGQHRVGMMALLTEEQRKLNDMKDENGNSTLAKDSMSFELAELNLQNVLVEVFPQRRLGNNVRTNDKELDDRATIFTEINKAEPVKFLDIPGVAPKQTRNIIDYAASRFHDEFPAMFSASQKCRAPHLNLDNLRDALFASEVIKRENIANGRELFKWMSKKNAELKAKYADCDASEGSHMNGKGKKSGGANVSDTALNKAKKHDFYLGLESSWLYK